MIPFAWFAVIVILFAAGMLCGIWMERNK